MLPPGLVEQGAMTRAGQSLSPTRLVLGSGDVGQCSFRRVERPIRMWTIKHTILFSLLVAALAGCASPETTRREMASWEGRPVKELIAAWGVPDRQQMFEGKRFYTWVWRGAQGTVAVPDVSTKALAPTRGVGYHMSEGQAYCERVAQVDEEAAVVQHITWEGNGCAGFGRK